MLPVDTAEIPRSGIPKTPSWPKSGQMYDFSIILKWPSLLVVMVRTKRKLISVNILCMENLRMKLLKIADLFYHFLRHIIPHLFKETWLNSLSTQDIAFLYRAVFVMTLTDFCSLRRRLFITKYHWLMVTHRAAPADSERGVREQPWTPPRTVRPNTKAKELLY